MSIMAKYNLFDEATKAIEKSEKHYETKLEIEFERVLKNYFESLGLTDVEGQYEEIAGQRYNVKTRKRQDSTYGKVIIEYEHVNALSSPAAKNHAISQITEDYLPAYPPEVRKTMVGIVFDGKKIIFIRWVNDKWNLDERNFDKHNLDLMINYILGLYKISLKELPSKFGFHRTETRNAIEILYKNSFTSNKRAQMLFDEWNLRFSSIYGNAFNKDRIKRNLTEIAKKIGVSAVEGNRLVFVIHTYYVFIVKIIAAEVAINLFEYKDNSYVKNLLDNADLKAGLQELEEGRFFKDVGVENFIEGTFLSWYIDAWNEEIKAIMYNTIKELDWFDFAEFSTRPEEVVDYLKDFYQGVFPKELRHDLGEFYTTDWLADYIVNTCGYRGEISKRVLDPACGSGTFLVTIMNKIYNANKKSSEKNDLVEKIVKNVVGFDINPVAVLTARTNYLISLERFNFQKTTLSIPVYLTDSIVLPELENQTKLGREARLYQLKTTKGDFSIPAEIKDKISEVMQVFKSNIEMDQKPSEIGKQLGAFDFSNGAIHHLIELYQMLYDLDHAKPKQDRIWCDIIVNQFATLFQEPFDFVIGNPPWVNWEYLSDEYQQNIIRLNDAYGLYVTKGLESRLGKIRRDISSVFFYVCADRYLKNRGHIAFLLKPMYQTASGAGFRNFNRITKYYQKGKAPTRLNVPLRVLSVENLTEENPFEINNEVSLIFAKKGEPTTYPIKFIKWAGNRTQESDLYKAKPVNKRDPLSSWIVYIKEPKDVFGKSPYTVRTGIYFGLKAALFDLDILLDKGKLVQIKNCEGKIKDIEKGRIYPLIMSRHLDKWKIVHTDKKEYTYCILPQDKPGEENEYVIKNTYPKTWEWLNVFKKELLARKSKMLAKDPFYSIFGLAEWNSRYKVVWQSMGFYPNFTVISSVKDKYLGKKLLLPEHVISFIPTNDENEAHYVCALLNSSIITEALRSLSGGGKSGLSGNLIEQIKLNKFNSKNGIHMKLADLSKKAHKAAANDDAMALAEIEKLVDEEAKKVLR